MKFKFSINQPCHENWANMSANEKGRFCDQCSKTVHDFTNHAPEEIAQVLKNGNGHICGRVPNHMLNAEFTQAGYKGWGAMALVGAAAFTNTPSLVEKFDENKTSNPIQINVQNNYYKISGSVKNEKNQVLGGAVIQILQNEKFLAQGFSLSTGNFALYIDKSKTTKEPITVRIQKDGYVMSEETIIASVNPDWNHEFTLNEELPAEQFKQEVVNIEYVTMGDIGYNYEHVIQESLQMSCTTSRVTGGAMVCETFITENISIEKSNEEYTPNPPNKVVVTFDTNKLNVFPNPATDFITVEMQLDKSYKIMLFDLNGKLIQQHNLMGNRMQLDVTAMVTGNYIVYITDEETQKSYSQKLVVVR